MATARAGNATAKLDSVIEPEPSGVRWHSAVETHRLLALMPPRNLAKVETARLMGLPDSYRLPGSRSAACHLTGDGVAVPVVRHLAQWLFEPLLATRARLRRAA